MIYILKKLASTVIAKADKVAFFFTTSDSPALAAKDEDGTTRLYSAQGEPAYYDSQDVAPETVEGRIGVYAKDVSGESELFFRKQLNGAEIRVTNGTQLANSGGSGSSGLPPYSETIYGPGDTLDPVDPAVTTRYGAIDSGSFPILALPSFSEDGVECWFQEVQDGGYFAAVITLDGATIFLPGGVSDTTYRLHGAGLLTGLKFDANDNLWRRIGEVQPKRTAPDDLAGPGTMVAQLNCVQTFRNGENNFTIQLPEAQEGNWIILKEDNSSGGFTVTIATTGGAIERPDGSVSGPSITLEPTWQGITLHYIFRGSIWTLISYSLPVAP